LQQRIDALEQRVAQLESDLLKRADPDPKPASLSNRSQEEIRLLSEAFKKYGEDPPKPALLAMWRKKAGSYRKLKQIIDDLGMKGHLAKGHAYVAGAVLGEEQREVQNQRVANSGYKDGEELDTGYRWSAREGRWVAPEEWRPA
jgi:hypothetical protein